MQERLCKMQIMRIIRHHILHMRKFTELAPMGTMMSMDVISVYIKLRPATLHCLGQWKTVQYSQGVEIA